MATAGGLNPEAPLTPEEHAYGTAYADYLAVGAAEPDCSQLDPERARRIRETLQAAWRSKVRRITQQRR